MVFQFSSVAQSYPTLCDPMNRSMPGLPVHHQIPELGAKMFRRDPLTTPKKYTDF